MAEIGVKGLGTGHRQEYGAKRDQPDHPMGAEKRDRIGRIEGREHAGIVGNMRKARKSKRQEPQRHHRAEECGDAGGAVGLHGKQENEDQYRERHHIAFQLRRCHFEAFHRRQHRDGRRQESIAVEQSRGDHAEQENHELRARRAERPLGKGHQGQCAAFALVVGAEQNEHIFRGDDEDEGPQDERQHAEHRSARQIALVAAGSLERDAEGIEWARADVAIDDTHAAERERPERSPSYLALSTVYSRDFGGPRHST